MATLIDWTAAERTANRLMPAPPAVTPGQARAVVDELFRATAHSADQVAELTHLIEPMVTASTVVVDRPDWVKVNVASMSAVMDPLAQRISMLRPPGRLTTSVGGRVTGAQAGALLAFLSGKVLGQFEFFSVDRGQLLLVAPNIVAVERQLGVDPTDFRLWVCLHEVTHRVQFSAIGWLRQHLLDEIAALTAALEVDPDALAQRVKAAMTELMRATRGNGSEVGLMGALATPAAKVILDRLTGLMSLVEGHAEYVMNAVSPTVIPTQAYIEQRFAQRRRRGTNPLDRLMRTLLGLDAKTRQYTQGSEFVREVIDQVGLDEFNAIWTSPATLPTMAEIAKPQAWVARVHG